MQKSGFPKMHHYVGFSQIGSHMLYAYYVKCVAIDFYIVGLWPCHISIPDLAEAKTVWEATCHYCSSTVCKTYIYIYMR